MTANLFLERTFDEPLTSKGVLEVGRESKWCFDLHRVRWHGSFLALDGRTMICAFSAPDLESARLALRDRDTDLSRFWPGAVYEGAGAASPNVVVERSFATPVRYEDIKALGDAKAWCLETYNVKYSHTFFSLDGKRMLCFYLAPDTEAVRSVQREAGAPVDTIWTGSLIGPARL
ncbi:MAG: DUF4242 domain-containing protein [Lysobacterales bacterium]|nr:MAG: DUF4242 domain-containing protein [Xanthomonadales bacterium]